MRLRPGEMQLMQRLVRELSGVTLEASKGYLVETRLGHLAEREGCSNFNEFYILLRHGASPRLVGEIVDAITTHETTWFRDGAPYDAFERELLPEVLAARARLGQPGALRVWSAACSSGQEPYSLAMVLHDALPEHARRDAQILATDISVGTVEKAARALYSPLEMSRTTRPQRMSRFFERDGGSCRVVEAVRRLVRFEPRNLMQPFAGIGPFDVVFLRNVLIYFDTETRRDLVRRIARVMQPHGVLVVGGSENLRDFGPNFQPEIVRGVPIYRPNAPLQPVPGAPA